MLASFCAWLGNTALAHALQTTAWAIPALQTVHILSVALVIAAVFLLVSRVLRLSGTSHTLPEIAPRLGPWIWWPVPVLLATGLLQITAEPERSLYNDVFWLKMGLLLTALAFLAVSWRFIRRPAPLVTGPPASAARYLFAAIMLGLWVSVIFAGRMIAYAQ